jgi:hypothetical protein
MGWWSTHIGVIGIRMRETVSQESLENRKYEVEKKGRKKKRGKRTI